MVAENNTVIPYVNGGLSHATMSAVYTNSIASSASSKRKRADFDFVNTAVSLFAWGRQFEFCYNMPMASGILPCGWSYRWKEGANAG